MSEIFIKFEAVTVSFTVPGDLCLKRYIHRQLYKLKQKVFSLSFLVKAY